MSEIMSIWDAGAHLHDEIYAGNVPYHRSHEVIVDLLPKAQPVHVLDLGAGTGMLSKRVLERIPDSSVTCVDFSSRMIEECERRLGRYGARVELVCADMRDWVPSGIYDAAVTCNALVYKELNVGECYAKYAEALRSGGLLLNSTVVQHEEGVAFTELMRNVGMADDGPPRSKDLRRFAQGPGRQIERALRGGLARNGAPSGAPSESHDQRRTQVCARLALPLPGRHCGTERRDQLTEIPPRCPQAAACPHQNTRPRKTTRRRLTFPRTSSLPDEGLGERPMGGRAA
jgi:SAM-dependent methyltransferase